MTNIRKRIESVTKQQIDLTLKSTKKGAEEGDHRKKQVYTLLYKGIHRKKMARIILLNINDLRVSLCKLRQFHYASCGYFIVQVEDFSIAV